MHETQTQRGSLEVIENGQIQLDGSHVSSQTLEKWTQTYHQECMTVWTNVFNATFVSKLVKVDWQVPLKEQMTYFKKQIAAFL